jgi:HD-like signal output (HDOD) protein
MADAGLTYTHVGEAFACGMLHDFGKLILLYNHPEAAQSVYKSDETSVSIRDISDAEIRIFGCDHIAIGADFSAGLGYPDLVTRVIRCHLYPEEHVYDDYADAVLIRATCAADVACSTLRLGFPHALSHDECALHDVWRQIAAFDLPGRHPSAIREDVLRLHDHVLEYVSIVANV